MVEIFEKQSKIENYFKNSKCKSPKTKKSKALFKASSSSLKENRRKRYHKGEIPPKDSLSRRQYLNLTLDCHKPTKTTMDLTTNSKSPENTKVKPISPKNRSSKRPSLPTKFKLLLELFKAVESSLALHFSRNKKFATFEEVETAVRIQTRKNLEKLDLKRMVTVAPEAIKLKNLLLKGDGFRTLYTMVVILIHNFQPAEKQKKNPLFFMSESTRKYREQIFEDRLFEIVLNEHKEYSKKAKLKAIDPFVYGEWHIDFPLEEVKLPVPSEVPENNKLPSTPKNKTNLNFFAKKDVLKPIKKAVETAKKDINCMHLHKTVHEGLKGVSYKLIDKIRKKSAYSRKINSFMKEREDLMVLEKARILVGAVKELFITMKRTKIPIEILLKELGNRSKRKDDTKLIRKQIDLLVSLKLNWCNKSGRKNDVLQINRNFKLKSVYECIDSEILKIKGKMSG